MGYKNFVIKPLIRKEIIQSKKQFIKKSKYFSLLIIGSSQGAKKFDNLFNEDLIKLSNKFKIKIYHQTSKRKFKKILKTFIFRIISDLKFFHTPMNYIKL